MRRFWLLLVAIATVSIANAELKYIFYMIGDGMGSNQVLAAEMYRAELRGQIGREPLDMTGMPYAGLITTYSHSNGITDSSAAGTALACGKKTSNGHLGTSPDNVPYESVAELLHRNLWNVGIMTSVAIDHATPGAFYAHVENRNNYYTIGTQLAESGFEFFGGAGFHKPENKSEWKAPNLYDLCEQNGYTIVHGVSEAWSQMKADKMILLQKNDGIDRTKKCESLPFAIDRTKEDLSLHEITQVAIDFLYAKGEPFFMMVEGGKIDYAGHSDDGATNIKEVMDFDDAVRTALRFYEAHPDETLIVVTADHETGGMALGNSDYTLNLQILQHQHVSSWTLGQQIKDLHREYGKKMKWEQVKNLLREDLDFFDEIKLSAEEEAALKAAYKRVVSGKQKTTKTLYNDIDELGGLAIRILNKKAKLGWTSYGHTAAPVPIFAIGQGAERFTGCHDNTDLAPILLKCAGM